MSSVAGNLSPQIHLHRSEQSALMPPYVCIHSVLEARHDFTLLIYPRHSVCFCDAPRVIFPTSEPPSDMCLGLLFFPLYISIFIFLWTPGAAHLCREADQKWHCGFSGFCCRLYTFCVFWRSAPCMLIREYQERGKQMWAVLFVFCHTHV